MNEVVVNEIVVGTDGSDASLAAVTWAAREAYRRDATLRVVYAVAPWAVDTPVDPRIGVTREWMHRSGEEIVERGVAHAEGQVADLDVTGDLTEGQPADVLIREARRAVMLVVGTRGPAAWAGIVLGSAAHQAVSHAHCPVVVVRGDDQPEQGEIVVGVDGSPSSSRAIGFAFEEAQVRKARLRAILAWPHPPTGGPGEMQPLVHDPQVVMAEEERTLAECLAGHREEYPDVALVHEVLHARPARALAGASARADLLVIGSRGRGGFTGLLLGSTGHAMLHQSHCPVAVVH